MRAVFTSFSIPAAFASIAFVGVVFAQTPTPPVPAGSAPNPAPAAIVMVKPLVKFTTSLGEFTIELEPERAPKTVANFMKYVNVGQYKDTTFHRVIPTFMIQGGGYTANLSYKTTFEPVENEGANGLSNLRGTVAMARQDDPHSATSQFFINTVDNRFLNFTSTESSRTWGYCVFGRVVAGMDVVDKIRFVKTENTVPGFENKPIEPVVILDAKIVDPVKSEPAAVAPDLAKPAAK